MGTRYVVRAMTSSQPSIETTQTEDPTEGFASFDEAVRSIIGFQHQKKEQAEDALDWVRNLARTHHGQPVAAFVK